MFDRVYTVFSEYLSSIARNAQPRVRFDRERFDRVGTLICSTIKAPHFVPYGRTRPQRRHSSTGSPAQVAAINRPSFIIPGCLPLAIRIAASSSPSKDLTAPAKARRSTDSLPPWRNGRFRLPSPASPAEPPPERKSAACCSIAPTRNSRPWLSLP